MRLQSIELSGFKSFAKKTPLEFSSAITSIVGPNGSGKSNTAEAFRFVLGEQSMKSMRGRRGEDLIWNGSPSVPRAGRASVKLVFDNTDRALNLDFDAVTIERAVNRDGTNEYMLNGSQVRLRDIAELLAQANIGSSSHHIISQGEADRILSTSPKERREMIEDALGLTAYLYKREDAEKKLEKTAENMREVEALRRELAPHLKFLAAQVKKVEESHALRADLSNKYAEYLKRESTYIRYADVDLQEALQGPERERAELDVHITELRHTLDSKAKSDVESHELVALESESRAARDRREDIMRELGRIEGELAAAERFSAHEEGTVPVREVRAFAQRLEKEGEAALQQGSDLPGKLQALLVVVKEFLRHLGSASQVPERDTEQLKTRKHDLEAQLQTVKAKEEHASKAIEALRKKIESEKDANRDAERELFAAMARRSTVEGTLTTLRAKQELFMREKEALTVELREAGVLLGRDALMYDTFVVKDERGEALEDADIIAEDRSKQEERRRKLERMKIKLEEIGAGNAEEVLKEHRETTERDHFLAKELADLADSSEKLHQLIKELTETLSSRFMQGIEKINTQFDAFFKLMFGGGGATLTLVQSKKLRRGAVASDDEGEVEDEATEDEGMEVEEGLEVAVNLPHKRVKGLHMLSGGERALTSIALIFAMSQVNPPPFLILDETDAALDEANSRRYGDMIENLAKKSQLIVITHNRETMSRAGVLYGVTMGSDGVSKLLSVNFEEASAVAK